MVLKDNECGGLLKTTVGFRQGDLSQTILYLYDDIENSSICVYICKFLLNILLYSDDVILLSRTKRELQDQLNITSIFRNINDMVLNAQKTNFIVFNSRSANYSENLLDSWQNKLILDGV